jgi:hypothetical protein
MSGRRVQPKELKVERYGDTARVRCVMDPGAVGYTVERVSERTVLVSSGGVVTAIVLEVGAELVIRVVNIDFDTDEEGSP